MSSVPVVPEKLVLTGPDTFSTRPFAAGANVALIGRHFPNESFQLTAEVWSTTVDVPL
jgi:hypothetical protein